MSRITKILGHHRLLPAILVLATAGLITACTAANDTPAPAAAAAATAATSAVAKPVAPAPRFLPWANTLLVNDGWEYYAEPEPEAVVEKKPKPAKTPAKTAATPDAGDGSNAAATPAAPTPAAAPAPRTAAKTPVRPAAPVVPAAPDAPPQLPDTAWAPVTLPHSWNAADTIEKAEYRRNVSWYRRTFHFTEEELREERFYLRFGAAGQSATVYVNGEKILSHKGGYSAFVVPFNKITRHGKNDPLDRLLLHPGANTVVVRVSNVRDLQLPPLSGDFNQYGGLYREVRLLRSPKNGFARQENGGNGFNANFSVTPDGKGSVGFTLHTLDLAYTRGAPNYNSVQLLQQNLIGTTNDNATFTPGGYRSIGYNLPTLNFDIPSYIFAKKPYVEITLTAPDGSIVWRVPPGANISTTPPYRDIAWDGTPLDTFIFKDEIRVPAPLLWSPETPYLYTLTARLLDADTGKEFDRVSVRQGFRSFQFTADNGFSLNGKPYRLRGVNRHQDRPGFANAIADAQHDADLRGIKDAGFNFVRLAHYQQDEYVLQRCDELGLLVWEEIPLVNVIAPRSYPPSKEFARNAKSMLREMITQHAGHPSVIIWGLGNEISYSLADEDPELNAYELRLIRDLNKLAHHLDPSRKTVIVSHDSDRASINGIMDIPDLIGYNLYKGWYRETFERLTTRLNELHAKNPTKPLLLSEYGAGADTWIHSETPRRFDYSEEYMVALLESYHDQFDAPALAWLSAPILWVFADFGAAHRIDSHPYINNKGLLDRNRQPKDAFFYLKARQQTHDPVLYLQSPSWTQRGGAAQKTYRVFSNMREVELFQDGRSLGKKANTTPPVVSWTVTLRPGANALLAKGRNADGTTREHGFTVNYDPDRAPRIAPIMPKH